jgi:hypothetical protein
VGLTLLTLIQLVVVDQGPGAMALHYSTSKPAGRPARTYAESLNTEHPAQKSQSINRCSGAVTIQ